MWGEGEGVLVCVCVCVLVGWPWARGQRRWGGEVLWGHWVSLWGWVCGVMLRGTSPALELHSIINSRTEVSTAAAATVAGRSRWQDWR